MLFNGVTKKKLEQRRSDAYQALLHYEAKLGGRLFGPIPKAGRREFFCLDQHTWIWHEEWKDVAGTHAMMTRYDVRPSGILKSQGTNSYQRLSSQEEHNFRQAARLYYAQVSTELQKIVQPV